MLTKQERNIIELCAEGDSNMQIAQKLCISEHTVKVHLEHIYFKLEAPNRTCAAIKAIRLGIIK